MSEGPELRQEVPSPAPMILVAEDDPAAAEMLELLLTKVGYQVRVARDGLAALRAVDEKPEPDIVLLDWMLPEISGLSVCQQIRTRRDALSLPILMVTAKADLESKSAAFAAGANDYITKPFLGAELRSRIAAHLRIKQLSEERRALDEHLMERQKLSTLGLLVSGVAHDLNNPLASIYGNVQLLLEEETDEEKRASLEHILHDVRRCNRIVGDLLSFARRRAPERIELDLAELLRRTAALRERQLEIAGIQLDLDIADYLPTVFGDPHQLQQVFVNILINAEQALREHGSRIAVSARTLPTTETGSRRVAIVFFNDGPPIPESVLGRIFEPFFTTKVAEEGTGLGLSICKRIITDHGGDIEVESGASGTAFTIVLPLLHTDELADEQAAESSADPNGSARFSNAVEGSARA